jgi:hypothetical protein
MKSLPLVLVLALSLPAVAWAADPPAAVAPVATRDWTQSPAIVDLKAEADILAVGDIHGDDERFLALLVGAGVVERGKTPDELSWRAGKSVLVLTGDLVDKGTHSLAVIRLVQKLEASAAAAGGRVVALAGNHEAEFLANPAARKGSEFRGELEAAGIDVASVASGNNELGAWLRARPFGARVDDWFFCHAGKTDGRSIAELEKAIEAGVEAEGWGTKELVGPSSLLEARLKPSPWWELPGEKPEAVLDRWLGALGVKHLAFGHQPGSVHFADGTKREKGHMAAHLGRVFLIDCGMSRGVGDSEGALLRIHRSQGVTEASAVKPDGSSTLIFRGE